MLSYVFQRVQKGKKSVLWSGRYRIEKGQPYKEVALGLTDKAAARAKLQQIVIEAQREAVGLLPPRRLRDAAAALSASCWANFMPICWGKNARSLMPV